MTKRDPSLRLKKTALLGMTPFAGYSWKLEKAEHALHDLGHNGVEYSGNQKPSYGVTQHYCRDYKQEPYFHRKIVEVGFHGILACLYIRMKREKVSFAANDFGQGHEFVEEIGYAECQVAEDHRQKLTGA